MDTYDFQEYIKESVDRSLATLFDKSDSYNDPDGDRLRNFKLAAELQHTTTIKALAGMMAKHTVKLYDLIDKSENGVVLRESWDETIGDSINYLLLLSALVREGEDDIMPSSESDRTTLDASGVVEFARKDTTSEEEALNALKQRLKEPLSDPRIFYKPYSDN